jgi:CRP/FNR family transcriptional regulator, cyclic AMP receptor protein
MVPLEELEGVSLMQQFKPAYAKQIASLARLLEFQADETIFAEGEPQLLVYLVLKGDVALEIKVPDAEGIQVHRVGPGELLGWSPLLGRRAMTATARALTRCRLAALDATQVLAAGERDPKFGMAFFQCLAGALAERLHATRVQLAGGRHPHIVAAGEGAD